MRITPRKAEVQEIVKLLESDDYDSADGLAKDVIKRVGELFAEREFYAYAWRAGVGSPVLAWGPLPSEAEVKKFATRANLGGQHLAVRLFSTEAMLGRVEEASKGKSSHCPSCGHPLGAHEHPRMSNKCAVGGCRCGW